MPGGAVFASRTPRWTLAVVARRAALSSLMLWDLRAVLGELEGGPPIRRSTSAEEGAAGDRRPRRPARRRRQGNRRYPSSAPSGDEREGEAQGADLDRGRARRLGRGDRAAHAARPRAARARLRPDRLRAPDPAGGARPRAHPRDRGGDGGAGGRRALPEAGEERRRHAPGRNDARRPRAGGRRCSSGRSPAAATSPSCTQRRARASRCRSTTAASSARRAVASAACACAWCRASRATTATSTAPPSRTCCAWRTRSRRRCAGEARQPAALARRRAGERPPDRRSIRRRSRRGARPTCCAPARSAPARPAPRWRRCGVGYGESRRLVEVYGSDGRAAADDRTRIRLSAQVVARRDDRVETGTDTRGGHAGFELLEDDPEQVAENAARRALTLLDAVDAPERPAAGRRRQRLRRRAAARGGRARARGGRRPEGRERLRRAGSATSSRAEFVTAYDDGSRAERVGQRRHRRRGHAHAPDDDPRGRASSPPTSTTCCARAATASSRPATAAASRSATCRCRA